MNWLYLKKYFSELKTKFFRKIGQIIGKKFFEINYTENKAVNFMYQNK